MEITDLEEVVWGEAIHNTIAAAISKLSTLLCDVKLPFRIESVISKGAEMEVSDSKGCRVVKTRPSLAGFRLVSLSDDRKTRQKAISKRRKKKQKKELIPKQQELDLMAGEEKTGLPSRMDVNRNNPPLNRRGVAKK